MKHFTDRKPLLSIRSIRTDRHIAFTDRYGAGVLDNPPQGGLNGGLTVYLFSWSWISLIEVCYSKFYISTLNPLPNSGIPQSSRIPLQTSTTFFIWSYKTSKPCNFTCAASLLNHCNKQYNLKEYNVSNQAYIYLNWNCTTLRNPSTVKKILKN